MQNKNFIGCLYVYFSSENAYPEPGITLYVYNDQSICWMTEFSFLEMARIFSLHCCIQTSSGARPAFSSLGGGGSVKASKVAGEQTGHLISSSAELKNM